MMHYNFAIFECLVSLGLLAVIWFVLVARARRDDFRCDIRRIRDRLFDFMWENGYDFSTPAYRKTRQTLNGLIRVSNSLTPVGFLLSFVVIAVSDPRDPPDDLDNPALDVKLKGALRQSRHEAITVMIRFVYLSGLIGVLVRFLVVALRAAHAAIKVERMGIRKAEQFLAIAHSFGAPGVCQI